MPMRKHEMVYVFYEKLPFYDLSSHTHKFLKPNTPMGDKPDMYGRLWDKNGNPYVKEKQHSQYTPPLPVSVIKGENNTYNTEGRKKPITREPPNKYDPPLPVSVVKEDIIEPNEEYDKRDKKVRNTIKKEENYGKSYLDKKINFRKYDPTLGGNGAPSHLYDPPLPVSVVKEDVYDAKERFKNGKLTKHPRHLQKGDDPIYDPPLPTSMLEIKSTRGKHSTEKPVALMEWLLKYYSKEGDTVLDPTMGSGSTGVACKNMNRNFIGFELDPEIYEIAVNRIEP